MDPFEISIFADGRQRNFTVERFEQNSIVYSVRSSDGDESFKPRRFYADKENCSLRFPVDDNLDHEIGFAIEHWCLKNQVGFLESSTKSAR